MKGFRERLKEIRKILGLTQKEMANIMGISLKVYQRYEKGEQKPSYEKLTPLISSFNLNINWLLTGEGEMFIKPKEKTSIEEEILQVIANEPEEKKKALLEFLKNSWASTALSTSEKQSEKNY